MDESATLSSTDGIHWTLGSFSQATGRPGRYELRFNATHSDVTNLDAVTRPDHAVAFWRIVVQPGDVNRDGAFNDADFRHMLEAGKYFTGESAGWDEGDFNADGIFDELDIIAGLQTGLFNQGLYFPSSVKVLGQLGAAAVSASVDSSAVDSLFASSPTFSRSRAQTANSAAGM